MQRIRRDAHAAGSHAALQFEPAALGNIDLDLPEEVREGLDEIFPGPGPSPEALAW